jgi:hypothetical protein
MAGPDPIYCPIFPDEVLENARAEVRRKTASYRSVQRSQLALLVHEHPDWDQTQLGREVGLSRRQVQRWRKRWAAGDFSLEDNARPGRTAVFSPRDHALVKALACERVAETGEPISRQSLGDLTRRAQKALGKVISRSTLSRILDKDAIKPWQYKYWIFPRDPQFMEKAGPILDLYAGNWGGKPLESGDFIISADEKTSIQARIRIHPSLEPGPGRAARIEFEYERGGALQYLAAWDVRRGYVMGRCEPTTGIEPFGRLVDQVLAQEPYCSAKRLFWLVDNGSSHRGEAACNRLRKVDPRIILVHTPVHASWLNQVEIYFSIIQRKVLTPNDFPNLDAVRMRLAFYENLSNQHPKPFAWKFTRDKLAALLTRIAAHERLLSESAPTHQGNAV